MSSYSSWVPTVGGRLSFSIIGDPKHNHKTKTFNVADDGYRYLICHQQRNLLDSAIPFFKKWLASLFYSYSGTFEFFLIAKAENDASIKDANLTGLMCFYPVKGLGWESSKASIIECFDKFNEVGGADTLSEIYNDQLKSLQSNAISKNSHFYAEFSLKRTGVVKIIPPIDKGSDSLVADEFFSDEESRRYASAQLFFFLKDISHVHQHHHAGNDTIIDLHIDEPEQKWRHKVIRSLYRRVLHFKRSPSEWSCLSSLGVLAYLRSFMEVIKKECSEEEAEKLEHLFLNDENINRSIKIALLKNQSEKNRKTQFSGNLRTIVLSVLGLIISLIGLASLLGLDFTNNENSETLRTVVTFLVENIILVFAGIIFISYVVLLVSSKQWNYWGWVTDIARLANTFPKQRAVAFLIGLSLAAPIGAFLLL